MQNLTTNDKNFSDETYFRNSKTSAGEPFLASYRIEETQFGQVFGTVLSLNEVASRSKYNAVIKVQEKSTVLLLPLKGSIKCRSDEQIHNIRNGAIYMMTLEKGEELNVSNSPSMEAFKFLKISMKCDMSLLLAPGIYPFTQSLMTYNKLNQIFLCGCLSLLYSFRKISIGKFNFGYNAVCRIQDKRLVKCFLFALEGSFYVDGYKLYARQGLSLSDKDTILVEALSENAVILIIEYGGKPDCPLLLLNS